MAKVFFPAGHKKVKDLKQGDLLWVKPFNYEIMEVTELEQEGDKYLVIGYPISEFTGEYEKLPSTGEKFTTIRGYHGSELVTLAQRIDQ